MKYSIKKGQNGDNILHINGLQSICPFTQPLLSRGEISQIQILRMPCSTQCPHASVNSDEDKYFVSCGGSGKQIFHLEKEQEKKPDGAIIIGLQKP